MFCRNMYKLVSLTLVVGDRGWGEDEGCLVEDWGQDLHGKMLERGL